MYESPTRNNGPSYAFGNKGSPVRPSDTPGPGNYEANNSAVKDKVPTFSMGKPGDRNSRAHSKSYS